MPSSHSADKIRRAINILIADLEFIRAEVKADKPELTLWADVQIKNLLKLYRELLKDK